MLETGDRDVDSSFHSHPLLECQQGKSYNRPSGTFQIRFRVPALRFAACRAHYDRASGANRFDKQALTLQISIDVAKSA